MENDKEILRCGSCGSFTDKDEPGVIRITTSCKGARALDTVSYLCTNCHSIYLFRLRKPRELSFKEKLKFWLGPF